MNRYPKQNAAWLVKAPLLRCLAIYAQMPWCFTLTAVLFAFANIGVAWQQWLIGRALNDVNRGHVVVRLPDGSLDYHRAMFWLTLLVGIASLRALIQYLAGVMSMIVGQELLFKIRERILVQIQRLDLGYHRRHGMGELVTRTTRDADKVRDALINFWRQIFETTLLVLASIGMLYWYSPWLGIVPLVLTLTGLAILMTHMEHLVELDRAVGSAYDKVNQNLTEGVNGVRVIKAFSLESARIASFETQIAGFSGASRDAIAYAARRIPLPQCIVALSHVWVLAYGATLIGQGQLTIGGLVASLLLANTLVLRVEGIGRVMQIFADARASAQRIWNLLDAEPQFESGTVALPQGPLGVRLQNVNVTTPEGGNDILGDISFAIEPGEIVALVGTTGSGKSTLLGLLPRLAHAHAGSVSVGSAEQGWFSVDSLDTSALRERVHVVPQESFLFSDTLAANLRLGAPDASDTTLRAALKMACAEDILDGLREGFATRLGDRGMTLSGGQRQRLCLARALLARPAVLGLDDATSALDATTERTVLQNIRQLRASAGEAITVLIVSSKLSTILLADRVLLLAAGRIAAQGTHAELASREPAYRDLMGI
jgi:ATP-binding cassette, subfamily B, bacterial